MSNSEFIAVKNQMMEEESLVIQKKRPGRCVFWWAVIATVLSIVLVIWLAVVNSQNSSKSSQKNASSVRWCTSNSDEQEKCKNMAAAFREAGLSPAVECVMMGGSDGCISALKKNEADAFTSDGSQMFNNFSQVKPILAENYGFGDATYWSVAVVKKSDNSTYLTQDGLRGKYACHTGYQRRAGWNMPMGKLKELGFIDGCGHNLTSAVSNLFGKICAPGGGENLCSGCKGTCKRSCEGEPYCRYNGAFRCLVEGGDVAFVKQTTVYSNTDGNSDEEWTKNLKSYDYELLCPNGGRAPLAHYADCNLGKVPSSAVVVSVNAPSRIITRVTQLLLVSQIKFGPNSNSTFKLFGGSKSNLLFKSSTQLLVPLHSDCSSERFLGSDYLQSMSLLYCKQSTPTIPNGPFCVLPEYASRIPTTLRWCTTSDMEQQKCYNISKVAQDIGNPLYVVCVPEKSETACAKMVGEGAADLVNLDGGHIYNAGRKYNVVPVAAEYYGRGSGTDKAASYYVVAVIKTSDDSTKLTAGGLRGKRTCHTGYQKTSGWTVPIGYLASKNIIANDPSHCDITQQVSNFFGGSCVPGVDKSQYPKLCSICSGQGQSNCSSKSEPYHSYTGALKCLEDGAGDIAFINHVTLMGATNQSQFKLLCKNGTTAAPRDYKTCNLEQVSAHALVTSEAHSTIYKEKIWSLLSELQKIANTTLFTSNGGKDLLFKDNTACLWKVQDGCSWYDYLGQDYVESFKALHCDSEAVPPSKSCNYVASCS